MDQTNGNICVVLLRYYVDKPETSIAQVLRFAGNKEDEKFQEIVYVNFEPNEIVYVFDNLIWVYDNVNLT